MVWTSLDWTLKLTKFSKPYQAVHASVSLAGYVCGFIGYRSTQTTDNLIINEIKHETLVNKIEDFDQRTTFAHVKGGIL